MNFKLSLFQHKRDAVPVPIERTWQQLCDRFARPIVRAEKDGTLFSPATFSPAHRLNENVQELALLVLDCDHNAELHSLKTALRQFAIAFAIYSTHSHRRVTESNPNAEPRYRVVVPLSDPISASAFSTLWQWASRINGITADKQTKDPARIFYTPAKWSATAPYEYHIEPGQFLDWRRICESDAGLKTASPGREPGLGAAPVPNSFNEGNGRVRDRTTGQPGTILSSAEAFVKVRWDNGPTSLIARDQLTHEQGGSVDFRWHEERHEELCRRIAARGKRNARGNYDARCLAHQGRGNTGLCYYPRSGAVACNAGCDYMALLRAEGLSDSTLRSHRMAELKAAPNSARTETQDLRGNNDEGDVAFTDAAKLHAVYGGLLAHLLYLSEKDEQLIQRELRTNPIGTELIGFPDGREAAPIKICSMPNPAAEAQAAFALSQWFDLRGVPGFYRVSSHLPQSPHKSLPDVWRINLPYAGGLLAPYDNGTGFIVGIRIYLFTAKGRGIQSSFLRSPFLLSSRGLREGTKALSVREVA